MTRLGAMNFARVSRTRLTVAAGVALAALGIGLFAAVQPAAAATFVPVSGAGSTWSYNAIIAWTRSVALYSVPVNYTADGSTSGRSLFAQGTVDWAASEIPYGVQDGAAIDPPPVRGYTYMPDTAGGVAFMYNLHIGGQQVTNLRLSGATVAAIFTNKITMWNDPAIAADNPGLTLPAEPIIPVVRSDGSGATSAFTGWMSATQGSYWTSYCTVVSRSPCTPTASYPVQPGTAMVGQAGDLGVSQYVSQAAAEGAIGYTEYSFAQETGFPVAKVLNAAGYYTAPTADNVGVSLLKAQIDSNPSDVLYGTAQLSQVYTDTDPRTYELSYYSYMILPTDSSNGFTAAKGDTLGFFGQYLLCQGQQQVAALGYAALPINLAEDGYEQLQKVPGASLPASMSAFVAGCNNPTFAVNGTNTLSNTAPMPPACDQQGPTQCAPSTTTGGAITTETTLTAAPSGTAPGQPVVLTATVSAADGTHPAGSVQFLAGLTDVGSPVTVSASGVATTTTTFAGVGFQPLSAAFTPTSTSYGSSTGTFSEFIQPPPTVTAGTEPEAVTVPAAGSFTLTVGTGTVNLAVSGSVATGELNLITVSDTRNTYPGWSVSGQASDFTGSGSAAGGTISGNQLGWTPVSSSLTGILGGPVLPTDPGLGTTAAVLASAAPGSGFGTSSLGANLSLDLPATAAAGPYLSTMTITAVTTGP